MFEAARRISLAVDEVDECILFLTLPQQRIAQLGGGKGLASLDIQRVSADSGVRLWVPTLAQAADPQQRTVTIEGGLEQVQHALGLLAQQLIPHANKHMRSEVPVPGSGIGAVLGKEGKTLELMGSGTGCTLSMRFPDGHKQKGEKAKAAAAAAAAKAAGGEGEEGEVKAAVKAGQAEEGFVLVHGPTDGVLLVRRLIEKIATGDRYRDALNAAIAEHLAEGLFFPAAEGYVRRWAVAEGRTNPYLTEEQVEEMQAREEADKLAEKRKKEEEVARKAASVREEAARQMAERAAAAAAALAAQPKPLPTLPPNVTGAVLPPAPPTNPWRKVTPVGSSAAASSSLAPAPSGAVSSRPSGPGGVGRQAHGSSSKGGSLVPAQAAGGQQVLRVGAGNSKLTVKLPAGKGQGGGGPAASAGHIPPPALPDESGTIAVGAAGLKMKIGKRVAPAATEGGEGAPLSALLPGKPARAPRVGGGGGGGSGGPRGNGSKAGPEGAAAGAEGERPARKEKKERPAKKGGKPAAGAEGDAAVEGGAGGQAEGAQAGAGAGAKEKKPRPPKAAKGPPVSPVKAGAEGGEGAAPAASGEKAARKPKPARGPKAAPGADAAGAEGGEGKPVRSPKPAAASKKRGPPGSGGKGPSAGAAEGAAGAAPAPAPSPSPVPAASE